MTAHGADHRAPRQLRGHRRGQGGGPWRVHGASCRRHRLQPRPSNAAAAPRPALSATLFNFAWQEYGLAAQLGVEPAGTQTGANAAAVIPAGIGLRYDGLSPNTTLLIPDGGFVVTDPVRLALPKGSAYAERVATIGAPPGVQRTTMNVDYFASANTCAHLAR